MRGAAPLVLGEHFRPRQDALGFGGHIVLAWANDNGRRLDAALSAWPSACVCPRRPQARSPGNSEPACDEPPRLSYPSAVQAESRVSAMESKAWKTRHGKQGMAKAANSGKPARSGAA